MKPVPEDIRHATLALPGEEHLEYWGPFATDYARQRLDGYLVLTSQRISFVEARGVLTPVFYTPLEIIYRVSGAKRRKFVTLFVNELKFEATESTAASWPGGINEVLAAISKAREVRIAKVSMGASRKVTDETAIPQTPVTVREREIIREVVRIPCRYCGALFDQTAPKCPSCGAVIR